MREVFANRFIPSLALICAAVAIVGYLAFVRTYGVNVPFWDEWELLTRFRPFFDGSIGLGELFAAKHNEHLIGTAFALMQFQELVTGLNTKALLFTDAALQILAIFLLILIARAEGLLERKQIPSYALLFTVVMLSLAQYKNILWAFQTAWYLITVFLLLTIWVLSRLSFEHEQRDQAKLATLAAVPAFLATFTSFHGILIWIAGSVFLLVRADFKPRTVLASAGGKAWAIAACATLAAFVGIYATKGLGGPGGHTLAGLLANIHISAYIFIGTFGSMLGDVNRWFMLVAGCISLALIAWGVLRTVRSDQRGRYAAPLALITFSLLFSALVALGRAPFGTGAARDSHYTAYSLLAIIGLLMIFAGREARPDAKPMAAGALRILVALIAVATVTSTYYGVVRGIQWRTEQGIAAMLLRNYQTAEDFEIERMLFGDANLVRRNADFMHTHALGLFASEETPYGTSVQIYATLPQSLADLANRYPADRPAIERLWKVYRIGADLRAAFDPSSRTFATDLVRWASGASADGTHYLSQYLKEFASNYAQLRHSLESGS